MGTETGDEGIGVDRQRSEGMRFRRPPSARSLSRESPARPMPACRSARQALVAASGVQCGGCGRISHFTKDTRDPQAGVCRSGFSLAEGPFPSASTMRARHWVPPPSMPRKSLLACHSTRVTSDAGPAVCVVNISNTNQYPISSLKNHMINLLAPFHYDRHRRLRRAFILLFSIGINRQNSKTDAGKRVKKSLDKRAVFGVRLASSGLILASAILRGVAWTGGHAENRRVLTPLQEPGSLARCGGSDGILGRPDGRRGRCAAGPAGDCRRRGGGC